MGKPVTKAQLQEALDSARVHYPSTATVAQLRALYDELVDSPGELPTNDSAAMSDSASSATSNVPLEKRASGIPVPIVPLAIPSTSATAIPVAIPSTSAAAISASIASQPIPTISAAAVATSSASSTHESGVPLDWARTQSLFEEEQARQERVSTLAQLEQEQRILLLQRDIQRLRGGVGESSPRRDSRIQFKDLENAVPEFSGDDNYSVRKWIDDFGEVVDVYDVDARSRYLAARKLLKGTE